MRVRSGVTLKRLILCSVFIGFSGSVMAADWPHWRGPDYTAVSKETDWNPEGLKSLKIAWKAEIGTGFSTISVADGRAYTAGNINNKTDVIYCFDAVTGKELWTYEYPEPLTPKNYEGGCNSTPTVQDGRVYQMSKTGKVFCLDAKTGGEIWKTKVPYDAPTWGYASSPVIVENLVILNSGVSGVALNKMTGDIVWKSGDEKGGYASAVPFEREGTKYIALFGKDSLLVIEALTGKVKWTSEWKTSWDVNAADPIVNGDEILITSGYNHGASLLKMTDSGLKTVWENKNMRSQMSGPVLIDGYLYGIDDNQLACVDWKTGEQKWTEKKPRKGSLCAAGDKLIVMGEQGILFIVQATPDGYQELSSAQVLEHLCWTMPVISNGYIYVRDAKKGRLNNLLCIDMRK